LKDLQNKTTNKSNLIVEYILFFKSLILKITLIALLIKIFKNYRIFRVLWRFTNWIAVSIFGCSLMDLYGIDYLANIIDWIKNNSLTQLFKTKIENIEQVKEIPSSLKTYKRTTTGNEESKKIGDCYNRLLNREPEVIIEDETPIYKNRYVITLAILLLLGLTYWGFKDSIDPVISDSIEKLQFFRSRANRDSTTICQDVIQPIEESNKSWWTRLTDKVKFWWNKDNKPDSSSDISLKNHSDYFKPESSTDLKGKGIDLGNFSNSEQERRLLEKINTGLQNRFNEESHITLNQMTTLIDKLEQGVVPENIKDGMITTIGTKLVLTKALSSVLWDDLLKDEKN
jgi:hypothetical protein